MELSVRPYEEKKDYQFFVNWCEDNGIVPRHESQLPPLGFVAEYNGDPSAMLFAYQALDCGVAFIECFICKAELTATQKRSAGENLYHVIVGTLR